MFGEMRNTPVICNQESPRLHTQAHSDLALLELPDLFGLDLWLFDVDAWQEAWR